MCTRGIPSPIAQKAMLTPVRMVWRWREGALYPRIPAETLDGTSSTERNSVSVASLQRGGQIGRLPYSPPRLCAWAGRVSTGT